MSRLSSSYSRQSAQSLNHFRMIESKYAQLLVNYCLGVKKGDTVYIVSTTLGEPLVREVYREVLKAGGIPSVELQFREQNRILHSEGSGGQLQHISPMKRAAFEHYNAYLYIRAPYNLTEDASVDPKKQAIRMKANSPINQIYSERTANGSMVRSLCQYPTAASAQEAGMSLEEYQQFVYNACHLYDEDPEAAWLAVRERQQVLVDYLNQVKLIRYVNPKSDISFSVEGRVWMNSDGRTNMPSGEVYTSPIEDSVNGYIHFDYPSIYRGSEVSGVSLKVANGLVEEWTAEIGQEVLDEALKIDGARYFGEVAIGTNYNIQRATKNILFDEKIGGTIHMAVGQSYIMTGGKNISSVHWDLIADMKEGGKIFADGRLIYEDGKFLI